MKNKRYISYIISIALLVISVIAVGENNKQITTTNGLIRNNVTFSDMKGVWVSYISLDIQNTDKSEKAFTDRITSIIQKTKDSGFNTLVFQVRPFSDALYKSSYYPWSHILTGDQGKDPGYDPLAIICDLCHQNKISVHAWINPYRVTTQQTPKNLCDSNPYMVDKSIGFTHNGSVYLDPSNEKARELIVNGVREIVENYDIDGIQFDDYFYPEKSDNVDSEQYNEYKSETDNPLSKEKWRAQNVNNLIQEVYKCVNKNSNKIVFGISPQGNINNNMALGADVKLWCEKEGYIDYICPQIYFSLDNPSLSFEESLSQWTKIKKHEGLKTYIGLAGYKAGSDEDEGTWLDNNDILKTEIQICEEKGLDGIMLYSYESFLNEENQEEIQNVISYVKGIKE